ncbi:MAG TPA: hypothetical protein VFO41_18165, partial [Alphaproteobacteria bacterium]|nr:hypothetical protein [Alphaproteobacteria bacterium]
CGERGMSGSEAGTTGIEAVRRGLAEVAQAVVLAQRTVEGGGLVDLAGLERRVEEICTAIRQLPRADGRALEPQLVGLIDDLGHLTKELGRQRDQARADLTETSSHQAAAAAYRKSQG